MKLDCCICKKGLSNYRQLSNHIKIDHNIKPQDYYNQYYGKTYCLECGNETRFKNINIGYFSFCSPKCSNINKVKDPLCIKKISESQKGKPRKKHTLYTKELISANSKEMWKTNRTKMMNTFSSKEFREKQSRSQLNAVHHFVKYNVNGIRCESLAEKHFVEYCKNNHYLVRRFGVNEDKSIPFKDRWVIPDFVCSELLVEVKDFHPWFKKELYSGLEKYKNVMNWGIQNGYFFIFWFPKLGWIHLEQLENIKNDKDLDYFLENYGQ